MRLFHFLLWTCLLTPFSLYAQENDELTQLVEEARRIQYRNFDSASTIALQVYQQAKAENDRKLLALCQLPLGYAEFNKGNFFNALSYYDSAYKTFYTMNEKEFLVETLADRTLVFLFKSYFQYALEDCYEALDLLQGTDDYENFQYIHNRIGYVFLEKGEFLMAKSHFTKALLYQGKFQHFRNLGVTHYNFGLLYQKTGELDSSLYYLQKANNFAIQSAESNLIAIVMNQMGETYRLLLQNQKAEETYKQVLQLEHYESFVFDVEKIDAYLGLAEIAMAEKNNQESIDYAVAAFEIAYDYRMSQRAKNAADILTKLYKEEENWEMAYQYLDASVAIENLSSESDLEKEMALFTLQRKEYENNILHSRKEINEKLIKEQKINFTISIILLITFLVAIAIGGYAYNKKLKREKILQEQKDTILKYNKRLLALNEQLNKKNRLIKKQKEELESANTLKDRLFSIVSHDLRRPLASLNSALHLSTIGGISQEEWQMISSRLNQELDRTEKMLHTLLSWSKDQLIKENYDPIQLDLEKVIQQNIDLYKLPAEKKGIKLINHVQEISVCADKAMLEIILRNLTSNAIKFTPSGGSIDFYAKSFEDEYYEITVADTGVGMSKEALDTLFSVEHVSTKGTEQEEGTGLGLLLCRDFVRKHQGKIWVESKEGEGTQFNFTLRKNCSDQPQAVKSGEIKIEN